MDQIDQMTSLMDSLAALTGTNRKPSWAEQMSKPSCSPMTVEAKCQQPDFCFFHTKIFNL